MKLIWSPEALEDLLSAQQYIAQDDPVAASRVVDAVIDLVRRQLPLFPHSGRPGRVKGTRELVVAGTPYIVPYKVLEDRIEILRVYHAARRWPKRL